MKMYVELSHDEVVKKIPYAVVCEGRYGKDWNTGRRKRLWKEQFTEEEQKAATRLFQQSRTWYLVKGVPDSVKMTLGTLALWHKLGAFCASI